MSERAILGRLPIRSVVNELFPNRLKLALQYQPIGG
jgi:hypothetical protein